jgi:hypothetical protein
VLAGLEQDHVIGDGFGHLALRYSDVPVALPEVRVRLADAKPAPDDPDSFIMLFRVDGISGWYQRLIDADLFVDFDLDPDTVEGFNPQRHSVELDNTIPHIAFRIPNVQLENMVNTIENRQPHRLFFRFKTVLIINDLINEETGENLAVCREPMLFAFWMVPVVKLLVYFLNPQNTNRESRYK